MMVSKIFKSPYLSLASGTLLLLSSGYETWDRMAEGSIGVRHGVLLFSLVQIFKSLPDVAESLEKARKVHKDLSVVKQRMFKQRDGRSS